MANFKTIEKKMVTNGWFLVRVIDSQYQYKHHTNQNIITISNNNGKDLSVSILKNLEKVTGLSLRG